MSTLSLDQLRNIAKALNISHANESATSLKALIDAATKGNPPKEATPPSRLSAIDPSALLGHFEEGRFTDCSILVSIADESTELPIERLPKRVRTRDSGPPDGDAKSGGDHGTIRREIKAHSVILASRSAYFERAMLGEWSESKDKTFEVVLADEEEYTTFHRLIKLCYGTTFVEDGDRDLDFGELVGLTHMANAFECLDAVKGCAAALQTLPLDWERAVQCIMLTDMLKGVEGMAKLAVRAQDALADALGFVHECYVPAGGEGAEELGQMMVETPDIDGLRLNTRVKDLAPTAFEALLSSERLKLKSENEAFWLLHSWVESQDGFGEEEKQALFERMVKHLRFYAMDPGYVLHVSQWPRIQKAGVEGKMLRESLAYAHLARRGRQQWDAYSACAPELLTSRTPASEVSWVMKSTFSADKIASVASDKPLEVTVGLVAGMPWVLKLARVQRKGGKPDRLAVWTKCHSRFKTNNQSGAWGSLYRYRMQVGARAKGVAAGENVWTMDTGKGWGSVAWDTVVSDNAGYLNNGELDVQLTIYMGVQTPESLVGLSSDSSSDSEA